MDRKQKQQRARTLLRDLVAWYYRDHGEISYELTQNTGAYLSKTIFIESAKN